MTRHLTEQNRGPPVGQCEPDLKEAHVHGECYSWSTRLWGQLDCHKCWLSMWHSEAWHISIGPQNWGSGDLKLAGGREGWQFRDLYGPGCIVRPLSCLQIVLGQPYGHGDDELLDTYSLLRCGLHSACTVGDPRPWHHIDGRARADLHQEARVELQRGGEASLQLRCGISMFRIS
jgi:hypothetical protein